jgi:trans-L-3-hydroxyproline dehydratase
MHAKRQLAIGETRLFESIVGSRFTGAVERTTVCGPHEAVIAPVGGRAFYTGTSEFILEAEDDLGKGCLLR